jgi:hypothetical protein
MLSVYGADGRHGSILFILPILLACLSIETAQAVLLRMAG